jgi:hypothetical protein
MLLRCRRRGHRGRQTGRWSAVEHVARYRRPATGRDRMASSGHGVPGPSQDNAGQKKITAVPPATAIFGMGQ